MRTITAPEPLHLQRTSIFLAGGISNCPLWQDDALDFLAGSPFDVVNPRRDGWLPLEEAPGQIRWEHHALSQVDAILFWFPQETLCPITLFELGAHAARDIPLFVGTHPEYARRLDVQIQMELARPGLLVHAALEDVLAEAAAGLERIAVSTTDATAALFDLHPGHWA